MEKVTFINSMGQSIQLGNEEPFILTKIEGTGAASTNIQTQKSPFQDGETYIDNLLEPRSISIEIIVLANDSKEMIKNRRKLLQVLNPKLGEGKLVYDYGDIKREIKAISENAPVFPDDGDFKDTMQPALIQLYCSNPFWLDTFTESQELADWVGGLMFPLQLPMMFAGRSSRQHTIIHNAGDVETPIVFEFLGAATNPRITKIDTGEYIQVNRTIKNNERLIITTEFGNKKVILKNINTGEETNAFGWIDLGSTFFQLIVGDNLISYSADAGQETAKVWIKWRNRYVGV